jgi:3-isopropylmalate dehydrogenase
MNINIALLPGDGIGPEVIAQAVKVIKAIGTTFGHQITFNEGLVGACAIDATGDPYPSATHAICLAADAVLFGAIGDPKYDNDPKAKVRPEQGLLRMRQQLGLFANVRPTFTFPSLVHNSPLKLDRIQGVDLVFFRELTGGIYFGEPRGRNEQGTKAFDTCVYSKEEIVRLARMGFEAAQGRRKLLTCVDKANVLATSRLWRETVQELALEYPDVKVEYEFVDAVAMRLIQSPKAYDVLITENLFGDILTDEASVISGSMGLMPSASLGAKVKLFEPIHGSYPQAAGKDIANPLATVLSAAMLFDYAFGLKAESQAITDVVNQSLAEGIVTEDIAEGSSAYKTSEVGDWLAAKILEG